MVFDLLHLDGRSLLDVPLERKRLLHRVLRPDAMVRYASHVVGDGEAFVRAAAERGWREWWPSGAPAATAGKRSRDWLKIKLRREQEAIGSRLAAGQGEPQGPLAR